MKRFLLLLPALLSTLARSPGSSCSCGGGSSTNGTVSGSINIIYTSATTNIGTSPGLVGNPASGVKLLRIEQTVTSVNDKPQGGSGLFSLLTDPVSGSRPTTSSPLKTFVKGGSGSPIQYGNLNASLQMEASSTDVYHPVEVTYENDTADYREHMLITPPSGHYLLSSLVAKETGGGWTTYPNQVILDPEKSGSDATFLRMVFVSERGDAHREPGDFTVPVMVQEENASGGNTLGDVTSAFTVWLGNDQATGAKQGRSWGRLAARPGLLSDVGAHQFRFVTAHSKVDDGGTPLVDEIIGTTGRVYQIKTAAVLLDVREVVTDNRGTATDYSDDLRKVTIRLTTAAAAIGPNNGIYDEPATPKYGTLRFEQTQRNTNGTFKTYFRQYAPGANPDSANPIAEYEYSTTELIAGKHRSLQTVRASLETEVVENFIFGAGGWGSSNAVRMETSHTHLGATSAGALLSTSRAMYDITTRGENLIRTESGSANGNPLDDAGWDANEALAWTTHTYHAASGTRFLSENSRGQWTEQHFSQVSFHQTVPSYYEAAVEGDRHFATVSPLLAKDQTVAQNIATGHVAITRLKPVVCNCSPTGSTKLGLTAVSEEYKAAKRTSLTTTAAATITANEPADARTKLTTARRADPQGNTAALSAVAKLWTLDYPGDTQLAATKRGRTEAVTALPDETAIPGPRTLVGASGQNVLLTQWTAPTADTFTALYSKVETDPSGRAVSSTTLKGAISSTTTDPTDPPNTPGTAVSTTTTTYSNNGTIPSIRTSTTAQDSIQISQDTYDPGLRKRTSTSAEGVKTETFFDALGRTTKTERLTAAGVAGTATYYDYEARTGGGTVQRVRQGTAAGTILVSEQASDNAGRSVASKDGAGLVTSYAYSLSVANAVTTEVAEVKVCAAKVSVMKVSDAQSWKVKYWLFF